MEKNFQGEPVFRYDIQQGTPEWLAWRRAGVGASEVAVLVGLSEDSTPYQIWLDKMGRSTESAEPNFGMLTGHEREAQMRAGLELELDGTFAPCLIEAEPGSIFRVSLDGWDASQGVGFEMKYVGKDYYEQGGLPIAEHVIKPKHLAQMQDQMLVSRARFWYYVKTMDGQNYKVQRVEADPIAQGIIKGATEKFWEFVKNDCAPAYCDRDWVPDERPELLSALAAVKLMAPLRGKGSKDQKEAARAKVFDLVRHARTTCGDAKISVLPSGKRIVFKGGANGEG